MKREEAFALLGKKPELVPLDEEQKKTFTYLWGKYKSYNVRRDIVGVIPDLYNNRLRYRELLTKQEDLEVFNKILKDPTTKF